MQNDPSSLENLIMPSDDSSRTEEEFGLTEKAIEIAETQVVIRDVLSSTLGNIFAFFALLFPPLIASSLELTARARGLDPDSDQESS